MKREKIMERNGGITLVALLVTIVVLLILAGISLNLVLGQNGIITRAQQSKNQTAEGKVNTEKAVNALTDEMEDLISENDNSGNSSNSGSDTGNEGSDEDDDDTDPDWKKLTVKERVDKITSASTKMKIFSREAAHTVADYMEAKKDDNGNTVIAISDSMDKASCECGHLRDIFEKAEEMNLVKTYTGFEYQSIENDMTLYQMLTATIKEESLVLFDFYTLNSEQKPGGVIPMAASLNYEITPNYKAWCDACGPSFATDGGDTENIMAWVDGDFVKNGFVGMNVRATMYPEVPIDNLGQVYHAKIEVLSKKNFVKAMKALNLDLSAYEGKCTHPVK